MNQIKTDREIRIAIVGCGRISKNNFSSIDVHDSELELVAVCDSNEQLLIQHKQQYKVNGYQNLTEMLKKEQLDVVSICTPSGMHSKQVIEAAQAGVHVITEKPMVTCWNDGLNMVRACDDANVQLSVVKQNRRNSTLQLLKRAIDEKRFGRIYMVHLKVFWSRPQSYYDQEKWRGTWTFDGGAFMNQASLC